MLSLVDGRALVRSRRYVCEIRDYNPIHVQPGVTWLCDMWHGRLCPSVRRFGRTSGRIQEQEGVALRPHLRKDVDVPTTVGPWSVLPSAACEPAPPARAHRVGGPVVAQRRSGAGGVAMLCLRTIITVVAVYVPCLPTSISSVSDFTYVSRTGDSRLPQSRCVNMCVNFARTVRRGTGSRARTNSSR